MFLCIREEHSLSKTMGPAALMMIALVLQSWKQMIICNARALENATLLIAVKTISRYRSVWHCRMAGQTSGRRYSSFKVSEHCLSLELWFHSCGVRNYIFGLKWQTYCLDLTWPQNALLFSSKPLNLLWLKWDIEKSPDIPEVSEWAMYCHWIWGFPRTEVF